jgi:hypothetical protein
LELSSELIFLKNYSLLVKNQTEEIHMEEILAQMLTIFIYAPIPLAILFLLIGAALSESRRPSQQTTVRKDHPDSRHS